MWLPGSSTVAIPGRAKRSRVLLPVAVGGKSAFARYQPFLTNSQREHIAILDLWSPGLVKAVGNDGDGKLVGLLVGVPGRSAGSEQGSLVQLQLRVLGTEQRPRGCSGSARSFRFPPTLLLP